MKMAKASERDIDAAGDLMALLNTIDDGYYPAEPGDEDAPLHFDEDDKDHLRLFYDKVKALLDRAPGFPGRVIGGMCYVIMYDKNEIIDPNADVIELHPKLQKALEDAGRYRYVATALAHYGVPFNPQQQYGIEFSPLELAADITQAEFWTRGPTKEEVDAAVDAAISAATPVG